MSMFEIMQKTLRASRGYGYGVSKNEGERIFELEVAKETQWWNDNVSSKVSEKRKLWKEWKQENK